MFFGKRAPNEAIRLQHLDSHAPQMLFFKKYFTQYEQQLAYPSMGQI